MKKTRTGGNIIVEDIKVGDVHYEFEHGFGFKCEVLTKPILDENGNWVWKSKGLDNDNIVDYLVNPEHQHYAPKLYDYEAYKSIN